MKTVWSLVAKLLILVVIVQGWFLYDLSRKNQLLLVDNLDLEQQLLASQDALELAKTRAEELEKRSLDGMLKETNKAVVSGWQTLMDSVEKELERARKALPEVIGELPEDKEGNNASVPEVESLPAPEEPKKQSIIGERT